MKTYNETEGYEYKKPYKLKVKYNSSWRGRSAAVTELITSTGDCLCFGLSGIESIIRGFECGQLKVDNGYIVGKFIMRKRGQNARWEAVIE